MIGDVAPLRDFAEGGVGVGIRDGSVALVEFHHVFGQVPAVGKPAARRLDSQRGGRRISLDVHIYITTITSVPIKISEYGGRLIEM